MLAMCFGCVYDSVVKQRNRQGAEHETDLLDQGSISRISVQRVSPCDVVSKLSGNAKGIEMKAIINFLISVCILALFFIALSLTLDADAAEPEKTGTTITLTAEEAKDCDDEGGCFLMTQKTAEAIVEYVKALQEKSKAQVCGKQI